MVPNDWWEQRKLQDGVCLEIAWDDMEVPLAVPASVAVPRAGGAIACPRSSRIKKCSPR